MDWHKTRFPRFAGLPIRICGKDNPLDVSNRRITLIVQYIVKDAGEESPTNEAAPENAKPEPAPAKHS